VKLSFSSNAFTRYSLFEAARRIAAAGYHGMEILADVPHLYAWHVSDAELEALHKTLKMLQIPVASLNANTAMGFYGRSFWEPLFEPSLAHPDPTLRQWRVDYTMRCIDMARRLECDTVSITSGRMVAGVLPEKGRDLLRASLRKVLDYAQDKGVRLAMEYEPGLLVECCAELTILIEELEAPNFGANLDFGHSRVQGENPWAVIQALGSRLFHVHLEDILGRKHYHRIPGHGNVDFSSIFKGLKRIGYEGFVTVELYTYVDAPDAAAVEALQYLKKVIGNVEEDGDHADH